MGEGEWQTLGEPRCACGTALQPQTQAGFQGLAVVFKLICRMARRHKVPD